MAYWIIIVDDDAANLKIAGHILSNQGMRVTALKSGRALIKYVDENGAPDVILLDIMMPEMDGFETLKALRDLEMDRGIGETPVVFLTADEGADKEKQGFRMGVSDYIRKPFDPDVLAERIKRIVVKDEEDESPMTGEASGLDLKAVSRLLEEKSIPQSVMWMGREAFGNVYRYMMRYFERYDISAYKALFTVRFKDPELDEEKKSETIAALRGIIQTSLRNSDIMVQTGYDQFFLLLPELNPEHVERVISRMVSGWEKTEYASVASVQYEYDSVSAESAVRHDQHAGNRYSIVVVDDSEINIKMASRILAGEEMDVTGLTSGEALFEHLKDNEPDLILLDISMPGMDGFDTMKRLISKGGRVSRIPIIFLTASDDDETEARGFSMGAMDFIRKPFIPEILIVRVKHAIRLIRLQNHLKSEVSEKTEENENLSMHIIQALASAIDAKDIYTSGHSGRVAEYAKLIAEEFGYDSEAQNRIYMMGLLHDVGKIGISDAIINKQGKLTDEEYEIIKTHPVHGANILRNIVEMPGLVTGARWHHERYDGKGYPDGKAGEEIPEEARIIAVADSYDAMTSRRSYRDALAQDKVRSEIEKGRGTQFDPKFADIMLQIIDEDKDYRMREI